MNKTSSIAAIVPNLVTAFTVIGLLSDAAQPATAQNTESTNTRNVFQMPRFVEEQARHTARVLRLVRGVEYADAEGELRDLIERFPDWPMHHYTLAAVLARQDRTGEAVDALEQAIRNGIGSRLAIESNPAFNTLRGLPRFQSLLDRIPRSSSTSLRIAKTPKVRQVAEGVAHVDETNTFWEPNSQTLISAFAFPETPASKRVRNGDDAISRRLNLLYGRRQAAGNHGDLYDNRDNGHSRLPRDVYPQVTHVTYGADAVAARVNYSVNAYQLFNAITFGNSSTAYTRGPLARSLARAIQTNPILMARTFQHYANDHIYVFPEVGDHDPGRGDLFPANTPYMVVSQGSSLSDQPFLKAIAAILAAFDPSVKAFLRSRHLVMPTLQMILRTSQKSLKSDEEYLTSKAHPSVFDSINLDVRKMIFLANTLRVQEIPPRVDLRVLEESRPNPGVSYFGATANDEVLFNTPSAIARVIRSSDIEKKMIVSAADTIDPNGHPLTFTWKVLQGDLDKIKVRKLKQDGSEVAISVKWHERRLETSNSALLSNRVDIAVFAHNGFNYSAPAFVSLAYPTRQKRTYDLQGRIREIAYDPIEMRSVYQDPVLFPNRGWRDLYAYTRDGSFIGWDRIKNNRIENYTRDGARVTKKDELGRAVEAERVVYRVKPGVREMIAVPTGDKLVYRYRDEKDRIGTSSMMTAE